MKIFISYASESRPIADRLRGALQADGHRVFQDREEIVVSEAFHRRIREEIQRSDIFLFLASKESVTPGAYALSELKFAERKWRNPEGHVVVFMLGDIQPDALPGYLGSVSAHRPTGDIVADVLAELDSMRSSIYSWKYSARSIGFGILGGIASAGLIVLGLVGSVKALNTISYRAFNVSTTDIDRWELLSFKLGNYRNITVTVADVLMEFLILASFCTATDISLRNSRSRSTLHITAVALLLTLVWVSFPGLDPGHNREISWWAEPLALGGKSITICSVYALLRGGFIGVENSSLASRKGLVYLGVAGLFFTIYMFYVRNTWIYYALGFHFYF